MALICFCLFLTLYLEIILDLAKSYKNSKRIPIYPHLTSCNVNIWHRHIRSQEINVSRKQLMNMQILFKCSQFSTDIISLLQDSLLCGLSSLLSLVKSAAQIFQRTLLNFNLLGVVS